MRENVGFRPAGKVKRRAGRHESKTFLRQFKPVFTRQHPIEMRLQLMKMKDVVRGVGLLLGGQRVRAPVGGLLLFAEVNIKDFLAELFKGMPVRISAAELRGYFGAIKRAAINAKILADDRHIETGVMEKLGDFLVREQGFEVWGRVIALFELHKVGGAVARGKLHQAQAVAAVIQAHGLGIDGNAVAEFEAFGQVAVVECDGHWVRPWFVSPASLKLRRAFCLAR